MTNPSSLATKEPDFKAEFFADLYEMESDNFWFRGRNKIIVWALNKYFSKPGNYLEVGCGTGYVLAHVKARCQQFNVSGSELFEEGLSFARKRMPDVNLFRLDARKMPFTQEYDVIGSFDVLEHIEEDEKVLSELWRATKHGLILTVPQHQFLWSAVDELGGHKRRYSAVELRAKLEKAGFTIVRMTSFVSLLLPLFVLSRLKKRNQRTLDKSEFDMPVLLNRSLEVVLDIERWLLKSGINLPMGGSLLVIATKNQTAL